MKPLQQGQIAMEGLPTRCRAKSTFYKLLKSLWVFLYWSNIICSKEEIKQNGVGFKVALLKEANPYIIPVASGLLGVNSPEHL